MEHLVSAQEGYMHGGIYAYGVCILEGLDKHNDCGDTQGKGNR